MLVLWIILAILGAALVYLGRRHERFLVYAGYLAFVAALVVFVLWLLDVLESEGVDAVVRLI